jgi:hypothetical protein
MPNSGNYHLFYRLPVTTSTAAKTHTVVCLLGGSSQVRFKIVRVFILSQKKYPDP